VLALRQQLLEAQREAELLRSLSRTQAPSDGVDGWTKRWGLGFMDWFKGKFTGNHRDFPMKYVFFFFRLTFSIQSIDWLKPCIWL
jgi:hypothetical protein